MRFSHHAKNEMGLYGIGRFDVVSVVARPIQRGRDDRGNHRLVGLACDGRAIIVVVAGDDPGLTLRADYDSEANAISIALVPGARAEEADACHPRAIVALRDGEPVELQILYPDLGFEESLRAAAQSYGLDQGALVAAVQAALAVPDRAVTLDISTA